MKTIQEIEKEYEKYPIKTDVVTNLDEFLAFIEIGIDDADVNIKDFEKEIKANKREKLLNQVQNFFYFMNITEGNDFYEKDDEILKECISYTSQIKRFYERMRGIATEENCRELTRLVDFSCDYYSAQTDYYDYLRNCNELTSRGVSLYDPRKEDNRDTFLEFMRRKVEEFEKQTVVIFEKGKGRL